jgi:hypothetical protein
MHKYNRGQRRPRQKALKRYNVKIQTQATMWGKQAKIVIKESMMLSKYKVKKIWQCF